MVASEALYCALQLACENVRDHAVVELQILAPRERRFLLRHARGRWWVAHGRLRELQGVKPGCSGVGSVRVYATAAPRRGFAQPTVPIVCLGGITLAALEYSGLVFARRGSGAGVCSAT